MCYRAAIANAALQVSLTGPLADNVRAAADARGLSPEDYVRQQLEFDVALDEDADDVDIEEDIRRLHEPGESIDADTVFAELREEIEKARSAKL